MSWYSFNPEIRLRALSVVSSAMVVIFLVFTSYDIVLSSCDNIEFLSYGKDLFMRVHFGKLWVEAFVNGLCEELGTSGWPSVLVPAALVQSCPRPQL